MKNNKNSQQDTTDRHETPSRSRRRMLALPVAGALLLASAVVAKDHSEVASSGTSQATTELVKKVFVQDLKEAKDGHSHFVATNVPLYLGNGYVGHPFILSVGKGQNNDTQYVAINTEATPIASSTPQEIANSAIYRDLGPQKTLAPHSHVDFDQNTFTVTSTEPKQSFSGDGHSIAMGSSEGFVAGVAQPTYKPPEEVLA